MYIYFLQILVEKLQVSFKSLASYPDMLIILLITNKYIAILTYWSFCMHFIFVLNSNVGASRIHSSQEIKNINRYFINPIIWS